MGMGICETVLALIFTVRILKNLDFYGILLSKDILQL